MNQDVNILYDLNDPDLTGPFIITIDYYSENPLENEEATTLSNELFYMYEDLDEAFKDWGTVIPPQEAIDNIRARYEITDVYVTITLYDSHNCILANTNFKWEDHD